MTGVLKVKDANGAWHNIAGVGPPGVSSVIVGSFGLVAVPADLPTTGLIPVDFDGVGRPTSPYQMEQGQSLYYDRPADPTLDGHLFQYVDVGLDPTGWLDIGLIQGPPGPQGPQGERGIRGPAGGPIPVGGTIGMSLVKLSDIDGDAEWQDAFLKLTGGVVTGQISTTGAHIKCNTNGYFFRVGHSNDNNFHPVIYGDASQFSAQLRFRTATGDNSGKQDAYVNNGGWSDNWAYSTTTTSPPGLEVYNTLTANDLVDRTPTTAGRAVVDGHDLDLDLAGQLIDALHPITFTHASPDATAPPHRRIGFSAEDVEASGSPLIERLVHHTNFDTLTGEPVDPTDRGYSVPGLLAVAVAEIKSLRARVAQLEGGSP
jgi:hypothetical protein